MHAREETLLLLFGKLRDATICCEIKLNATPADWGKLLNDFDTEPEQSLLHIAAQLGKHISHL